MPRRLNLLLTALLLAACSPSRPAPTASLPPVIPTVATFTPRPPVTPSPSAALGTPGVKTPLPTPSAPVEFPVTALDGVTLASSFYPPILAPAPAVLLLHMLGGSRADWDPFARSLQARGFAVMTLDLRGHGGTPGPADWDKGPGDVRTAWDALIARREVDPQATALVGASIGANLALIVGANNPGVTTVAALSPGLDYHNLKPSGLLGNFGARPVLLLASQDDGYAYTSAQQMAGLLPAGETYYFARAGHGTQMFSDPGLEPLLLEWLQRQLGVLKG